MIADAILNRLSQRLDRLLARPVEPLRPWIVDGAAVGFVDARRAALLAQHPETFVVDEGMVRLAATLADPASRTAAVDRVVRVLAAQGQLTRWRDERYPVRRAASGAPLLDLERAAARFFGIATEAVHVNGVTSRNGATLLWIARRSAAKPIDPGQLDNLVGGGVRAGASVAETVVAECREEAGIPAALARTAQHAGIVRICREQPDGVQRETIHVHDLALPPDFLPVNQDGEVAGFLLVPPARAAELAAADDDPMTADAALVVADWLMRHAYVPQGSPAWVGLEALRRCTAPPPLAPL